MQPRGQAVLHRHPGVQQRASAVPICNRYGENIYNSSCILDGSAYVGKCQFNVAFTPATVCAHQAGFFSDLKAFVEFVSV